MIINVENISRVAFEKIHYSKTYNITPTSHAFISIYGTDSFESEKPKISRLWHSGIQLQFDDVIPRLKFHSDRSFNQSQAETIISFTQDIHKLPERITIIVHCYAGVSRSAGVTKWINDFYGLGIKMYENHPTYNLHVYDLLQKQSLTLSC